MKEWKEIYFDEFIKLNRGFDLPNEKVIEGKYPIVASTSIKAYHNEFKVEPPGVVSTTATDDDAAPVIELPPGVLIESITIRREAGSRDRLIAGIKAEQIGPGEQLVQLPVGDQGSVVHPGHLGTEVYRPPVGVPLANRRNGGTPAMNGIPYVLDGQAGAADGAHARDHDAWNRRHAEPTRESDASTSSGWRKTSVLFEPPKPSELDMAARIRVGRDSPRTMVTSQSGSGIWRLALTGASCSLMASAQMAASTAPAAAMR